MDTLQKLFRHNAWANRRVFEVVQAVGAPLLRQEAKGTHGSIEDTLKHLVGVEDVYLAMLNDQPPNALGSQEAYFAHDLAWFAVRAIALGQAYIELVAGADEAALAPPLHVPWLGIPLTAEDGLVQVLTHSAQHRAQVFSTLGEQGYQVPDLDYVVMVQEATGPRAT